MSKCVVRRADDWLAGWLAVMRGVWYHGAETHHIDELGELETQLDGESVGVVSDGPDESVVGAEEVVVEPLSVRIGVAGRCQYGRPCYYHHHPRPCTPTPTTT